MVDLLRLSVVASTVADQTAALGRSREGTTHMALPTKEQSEAKAALLTKITELVDEIDGSHASQVNDIQRLAKAYALIAGTVSAAGD